MTATAVAQGHGGVVEELAGAVLEANAIVALALLNVQAGDVSN